MSAPTIINPPTTGGGPPVGGSGTIDTVPKWNTTTTLGNSVITQSGSNIGIGITPITGHRASVSGKIGGGTFGDSYIEFQSTGATALRANNTVNIGYSNTVNVTNTGLVGIGTASPSATLQVAQGTSGSNTVSNSALGTTVTGVGTQFLDTFKVGDTITIVGQTVAITAIASNTSMTTAVITNANSGVSYTLVGGTRFSVLGNGNVGIGTTGPTAPLHVAGDVALYPTTSVYGQLEITGKTLPAHRLAIGYNSTTNCGFIQSVHDGTAYTPLLLNPTGANVGIGTTAPVARVNVTSAKTTLLSTQLDFNTMGVSVDDSTAFALGVGGGIAFRGMLNASTSLVYGAIDVARESAIVSDYRGSLRFWTNQNTTGIPLERMRIDSAGNIGIGTAGPGYPLEVAGNCAATSFISTSDERDKNILGPVAHGLAFVEALRPIAYQFRTSREDPTPASGTRYGFSAQSVLALEGNSPAIIDTQDADKLRIHDAGLVPILVNALQELNAKFEAYVAAQEAKCL